MQQQLDLFSGGGHHSTGQPLATLKLTSEQHQARSFALHMAACWLRHAIEDPQRPYGPQARDPLWDITLHVRHLSSKHDGLAIKDNGTTRRAERDALADLRDDIDRAIC